MSVLIYVIAALVLVFVVTAALYGQFHGKKDAGQIVNQTEQGG